MHVGGYVENMCHNLHSYFLHFFVKLHKIIHYFNLFQIMNMCYSEYIIIIIIIIIK